MIAQILILIAINIGVFIIGLGLGYMYGQRYKDNTWNRGVESGYAVIIGDSEPRDIISVDSATKLTLEKQNEFTGLPDYFKEHPLSPETMAKLRYKFRERYHNDRTMSDAVTVDGLTIGAINDTLHGLNVDLEPVPTHLIIKDTKLAELQEELGITSDGQISTLYGIKVVKITEQQLRFMPEKEQERWANNAMLVSYPTGSLYDAYIEAHEGILRMRERVKQNDFAGDDDE